MQVRRNHLRQRPAVWRATLSGVVALLFLTALTVASSEWLHHCLHAENTSPHHFCAVKVLAHSQTDCLATQTVLPLPATCLAEGTRSLTPVPLASDHFLPPDRAPPGCA